MSRQRYPDELKQHILSEAEHGVAISKLAREYEPCAATIHAWIRAQRTPNGKPASTPRERELEKEVARLGRELAFLKRAATWFARECGTEPGGTRHTV